MVSSAIWKKNMHEWVFQRLSKLHESEERVQFFFKLHEKPYYYLLIYMKKLTPAIFFYKKTPATFLTPKNSIVFLYYFCNPRNSTIFASANNCRSESFDNFRVCLGNFFAEARDEITLNSFGNYFGIHVGSCNYKVKYIRKLL